MMGWRELLATGHILPPDARFEQGLDAIGGACTTLERIAVDATRMAEAQEAGGEVEAGWHETAPLLEQVASEVRRAATAREVALLVDVEGAAARAFVDAAQLARAVDALVSNGVRFTPDGGTVRIEARAEGTTLLVHVRDSGIGLSAVTRARLSERTIAPRDSGHHHTGRGLEFNHQGLGFGLALARRVVEAHGGELRIEGEEGRGSTFTLVVPDALASGLHREAA